MDEAIKHCTAGIGIWEWASNDQGCEPDVSWRAAVTCRRSRRWRPPSTCFAATLPQLKVRVINVVDLMKLQSQNEHPHGLPDGEFDALFTTDKPIIFAFHGYPSLIHRLTYSRTNHSNLHVRGYREEGTTTTPFDMVVLNDLDRFHLVSDVIDRVPKAGAAGRVCPAGDPRKAAGAQAVHRAVRRRHAGHHRMEVGRRRGDLWPARQLDRSGQHLSSEGGLQPVKTEP